MLVISLPSIEVTAAPNRIRSNNYEESKRGQILVPIEQVGIWFLGNDQREAQFFSMYLFIFLTLYMFRAHRAHHQERNCVNATSGSCHSVSVAVSCAGRKWTKNHYMMHGQQNIKGWYLLFPPSRVYFLRKTGINLPD